MIITISNVQVKTKLNNFIKTCDSLLLNGKDINVTSMAINAFKVLRSFLKKEADYAPILEMFNTMDIVSALEAAKKIAENEFAYIFEDVVTETVDENVEYKYKVGDSLQLGKKSVRQEVKPLEWIVIKVENDKALIFSEKAILFEPFDIYGDTEWDNSSLKHKLNNQWLMDVFSDEEREIITYLSSTEDDEDNQEPILILPNDELIELLPTNEEREDKISAWWTSTKDDSGENMCYVQRNGEIQTSGVPATKKNGVRPAFWIVNPIVEKSAEETEDIYIKTIKKIIIVTDAEDYYIAEATKDDEITSTFLRKFIKDSTHYETFEAAEMVANKLADIYSSKFDVELTNIVLADLMNKEYEIANRKYILKDKDDNHILYVDAKGKISFPLRESDIDCICIDKVNYQIEIDKIIKAENAKLAEDFDYFTIGKITGYEVALNCDAPHIRYEIFKAEGIIESYDEFPEIKDLFEEDEKYHKGYIEALQNALSIQHSYSFNGADWSIEIVDLRSENAFTSALDKEGEHVRHGHYTVHIYNEIPNLEFDEDLRYVVVALVDKNKSFVHRDTEVALNLPETVPLIFASDKTKSSKIKLAQLINTTLNGQTSLSSGDSTFTIDPKFVPALANLKEYFADESEDDDDDKESDTNENFFIEQNSAINMRTVEDEDAIQEFQFKDNKTLTSIKLPNKLKILPEGLFMNCTSLDYVTLPLALKEIGKSAFEGCTALWKLFLPDTIRIIGSKAFFGCDKLKSIYLPQKLEEIGSEAFCGCSKLTKIYFPANIKYIAEDAFDDCVSLTKIKVPYGANLPTSLLEKVHVDYYTKEQSAKPTPSIESTKNTVVSEITEETTPSLHNEVGVNALLSSVLTLLENSNISNTSEIGTVLNLLEKEYEND